VVEASRIPRLAIRDRLAERYRRGSWMARRAIKQLRAGRKNVSQLPIVFANAIPKSGSNLLFNIVHGFSELGPFVDTRQPVIKPYIEGEPTPPEWIRAQLELLRPGDIRIGYLYGTPANIEGLVRPGWANFLIIRDPRDNIVSEIFYALEIHMGHALHTHFQGLTSMEQRIATLINGIPEGELRRAGIYDQYMRFVPWVERPEVHVVRFEELIADPERELGRMLDYLNGFGFSAEIGRDAAIERLRLHMDPSRSNTYRKGRTGAWKAHFTDANRRQLKRVAGELLIRLGYEASLEW
jgi:hypothetical protein